jgi:hypothetical protein
LEDAPTIYAPDVAAYGADQLRAFLQEKSSFWSLDSARGTLQGLTEDQLLHQACGELGGCNYSKFDYTIEEARRYLGGKYESVSARFAALPEVQRVAGLVEQVGTGYQSGLDSVRETTKGAVYNAIDPKGDTGSKFAGKLGEATGTLTEFAVDQVVTAVAVDTGVGLGGKALGTAANLGKAEAVAAKEAIADDLGLTRLERKGRATFQGMEVRAIRDLAHLDESTLRAMERNGFAAVDQNGEKLILRHLEQNPNGPLVEMPGSNHSIGNEVQHPRGNAPGAGLTPEKREQFNQWRTDYWQARAREELDRRGLP